MWQSNRSASSNYQYYSGNASSYDPNNHHSQINQNAGYQPYHHASGWGKSAQSGSVITPAMHNGSIGSLPYPFSGEGSFNSFNEQYKQGNSVQNQGSGHVLHGQGSWYPDQLSTKALPSPVFQNDLSHPPPNPWPTHEVGSNSMYHGMNRGGGFTNNFNHNHGQGPPPPMEGYQPMQFTPMNHRPNISGPPGRGKGRGNFPQNQRGGKGGMVHARGGNNFGASRGQGRKKLPRPPKSTGKSNETWHSLGHVCDPCERYFQNEEQLAKHISEHQTCGIDGCKLTAHSGVIEKHKKMQHDTGLFQKMKDLVNSNDFAKWRAERKLRYPSKENVVKRQEAQEEKLKRGESIGNENGRFPKPRGANFRRHQRRDKSRQFKTGLNNDRTKVDQQENLVSNKFSDTNKEEKRSKPHTVSETKMPFSHSIDEEQIQDNEPEEDKAFSDTEWEPLPETEESKPAPEIPKLSSALNSLASMYDTDSDQDSDTGSPKPIKVENITAAPKDESINEEADSPVEMPICREAIDKEVVEKEEKEDGKNVRKVSNKRNNRQREHTEGKPKQRKMNHCDKNTNWKKKPDVSLLQKLLASEIRHERNVILQCIRYITENNFLEVIPPKKSQNKDCTPGTTLCNNKVNLPLPTAETKLVDNGFVREALNSESSQITCGQETAACDTEMNVSLTVNA